MSYSITPVLHTRKDGNGLQKILIRIIYKRINIYEPTGFKVRGDQWAGVVINHANKKKINDAIAKKMEDIEGRIIDIVGSNPSKEQLKTAIRTEAVVSKSESIFDYIIQLKELQKDKLSPGVLRHYQSLANRIEDYSPGITFDQVNTQWLERFEAYLRTPHMVRRKLTILEPNTIHANLKRLKGILVKAVKPGHLKTEAFEDYIVPLYRQNLFDFLTEAEVDALFLLVKTIQNQSHKMVGYYFLLSCKAGYRISDLKKFNYQKRVVNNAIILRAGKNGRIVSFPVYPSLGDVLEYIKGNPLTLSEKNSYEYLKQLCTLAGVDKKVSFHTGRRTFAMTLLANNFTIDEVAEALGDSKDVARVYAQMNNSILAKKVLNTLK